MDKTIDFFLEAFDGDSNQGIVALCEFIDKLGKLKEFKEFWTEDKNPAENT